MRPGICLAQAVLGVLLSFKGCSKPWDVFSPASRASPGAVETLGNWVGQPAPKIVGHDLDGVPLQLSDYRGKVVILNFWSKTCPPCLEEMPSLASLAHSLAHRSEALAHALRFARGMDPALADRFVGMWVNERTVDCDEAGRRAVQELLDRGHAAGIVPARTTVDFVAA